MGNYENFYMTWEDEQDYPFNYNPVHAIWRCLRLVGLPVTWLDSSSFLTAAQTIHSEGVGVCVYMRDHQEGLTYIKSLLNHINAVLYYENDGKLHIKLIRDDYVVGDLPVITPTELISEPTVDRGSWMETVGEVQVQYNAIRDPDE